ncbi:MAG TPA: YihY/virulence factor BrkB family protein [Solirubrobacterales bacterium]|nr:YihY/virulence factor BrkB family protein [Solirubrobacterales bacterium]
MAYPSPSVTRRRPLDALKGVAGAYGRLKLSDHAAALTYYAILSIFPGMIVFVSLIGIFGDQGTIDSMLAIINDLAPGGAADTFEGAVEGAVNSSGAGVALVIGVAIALYSASGYIGAFGRAANDIYEVPESRPFWHTLPRQVALTAFLMIGLAATLLTLILTGPLSEAIFSEIGLGDTALTVFTIAKWPILAVLVALLFAVLIYEGPDVDHRGFRTLLPGSFLATFLWLVASALFSLYVANFGSYSSTYGSIAGVIVFLVWLWLSNLVLLIGATFNVELERSGTLITESESMAGEEPAQRPPGATAM